MVNCFQEVRQRVSVEDAARLYGLEFNSRGWCRCPFHEDHHASMRFRQGHFRCWACNASGDSIDFVSRLFNLKPLEALEKLNRDFSLALPLDRDPTPEERQADRRRRELDQAHREFEAWRIRTISQLNAAYRVGHEALKGVTDLNKLAEAVRCMSWAEYLADTLAYGTPEDQAQIFRDRQVIEPRIEEILKNTLTKSGAA